MAISLFNLISDTCPMAFYWLIMYTIAYWIYVYTVYMYICININYFHAGIHCMLYLLFRWGSPVSSSSCVQSSTISQTEEDKMGEEGGKERRAIRECVWCVNARHTVSRLVMFSPQKCRWITHEFGSKLEPYSNGGYSIRSSLAWIEWISLLAPSLSFPRLLPSCSTHTSLTNGTFVNSLPVN